MTNRNSKTASNPPPAARVRVGNLQASIWARPTDARTFFDISFQRSYRDQNGHWKNTQSFDLTGLLALHRAVGLTIGKVLELQSAGRVRPVPTMRTTSPDGEGGRPSGLPPIFHAGDDPLSSRPCRDCRTRTAFAGYAGPGAGSSARRAA